jgi:hypothetical protein
VSAFTIGTLLALEGVAMAISYTEPTNLTIHRRPTGAVDRGTLVTIRGRLRSDRDACERGR